MSQSNVKLNEDQQKIIMGLQTKLMEYSQRCRKLKAEQTIDEKSKTGLESTLAYLKKQPKDAKTYASVGRTFCKENIAETISYLETEIKELDKEMADAKKLLVNFEKSFKDTQVTLIEYLKANNIPFSV